MSNDPSISSDQAKAIIETKTAPRITEAGIKDRIATVTYNRIDALTICVITMVNGFHVVGTSAPASPSNFDESVGERYAFDDAFKKLWPLEGYLLKDRLHREQADAQPEQNPAGT